MREVELRERLSYGHSLRDASIVTRVRGPLFGAGALRLAAG
jgi:hypothetical protein